MPDRIKNAIVDLMAQIGWIEENDYHKFPGWQNVTDAMREAVALLKEQEAVEPIPPTDESDLWRCGNCNHQLFRCAHQRYCESVEGR